MIVPPSIAAHDIKVQASKVRSSPFDKRLMDLQFFGRPEDAEELAWLEDYTKWKSNGGPERFDAMRNSARHRQYRENRQLMVSLSK